MDRGAYTLPSGHRDLLQFLGGVGVPLSRTAGTASTIAEGIEHRIKIGSPFGLFGYRLLPMRSKVVLAGLFGAAVALRRHLDVARPTRLSAVLELPTAKDFLVRVDRHLVERIAYPIFSEIFLGTPEENSRLALLATLSNLLDFAIYACDSGMGAIAEVLASEIDVRLNCSVCTVVPDGDGGCRVTVGSDDREIRFDAAVVAVPGPNVSKLVPTLAPDLQSYFRDLRYAPGIVVALAADIAPGDRPMIVSLLRDEFRTIATLVFDHEKSVARVPQSKTLVTAIVSPQAAPQLIEAFDETILSAVLADVEKLLPHFGSRLLFSRIQRWPHAVIQMQPGFLRRRDGVRGFLDRELGPVFLAGDATLKSSLEIAFRSGRRAADRALQYLGHLQ